MAESECKIAWPHAPTHRLEANGTYFVTGRTYDAAHHFRGRHRVQVLHRGLLKVAQKYGWRLEAWAVFSNHYHFIGHCPSTAANAESLADMLKLLHCQTAIWVNKLDQTPGRVVWYNFWETRLTFERSYLARLNYVHQNPVRHGLVPIAHLYPWCSASWFERTASPAQVKSIYKFKTDQLNIPDSFAASPDW